MSTAMMLRSSAKEQQAFISWSGAMNCRPSSLGRGATQSRIAVFRIPTRQARTVIGWPCMRHSSSTFARAVLLDHDDGGAGMTSTCHWSRIARITEDKTERHVKRVNAAFQSRSPPAGVNASPASPLQSPTSVSLSHKAPNPVRLFQCPRKIYTCSEPRRPNSPVLLIVSC